MRLRDEQKRLEQDHDKREREREARLQAATNAAAREQVNLKTISHV